MIKQTNKQKKAHICQHQDKQCSLYLTMIWKLICSCIKLDISLHKISAHNLTTKPSEQWVYLFLLTGWKKLVKLDCFWGDVCAELFAFWGDGLRKVFGPTAAAETARTWTELELKRYYKYKIYKHKSTFLNLQIILFFSVEAISL